MPELFRRLARHPIYTTEILISTLFISLLTLASPMFVIQVLNRYVTHGFSGTLITLTVGMFVAIALQFGFRMVRTKISSEISSRPDANLSRLVFQVLARAKTMPLSSIPKPRLNEIVNGLQVIKTAYNAANINAILDAPFALLFLIASFLISPTLAYISVAGIGLSLLAGSLAMIFSNRLSKVIQGLFMGQRGMLLSMSNNIETVRAFRAEKFLESGWHKQHEDLSEVLGRDASVKEFSQTMSLTLNLLMSVCLYAVGAVQVVEGSLTVGGLIGVNILAGRAFSSTTKFVQSVYLLLKASNAFEDLKAFFKLPIEQPAGTTLKVYQGNLQFKDLAFGYVGGGGPLFESLNLVLGPGEILVVNGYNGSGKTTLARLCLGLMEPARGEILADGVNLRQLAPQWWRQQVAYLPQEPSFLNGSILQNIMVADPDMDMAELNRIIGLVDLRLFLDRSSQGLESPVLENGRDLPVGIRRRIGLARALVGSGRLTVFDEPTEGLDEQGRQAVYRVLNDLAKAGRTIIVISSDPMIGKAATHLLDLSEKPVPRLDRNC